MISCKECATLNSLDSAFCKKCGKALAKEDALDAREKMEKQLDQGYELLHHGRTDEAALLAETALASDPTCLRALSLRAMVLERKGLIVEALETYETIVARDPNAALERMKVQTLRGVLDVRSFSPPQGNRRLAMGIAACTMIAIVALAAALISRGQGTAAVAVETPVKQTYGDTFAANLQAAPAKKAVDEAGKESGTQTPQTTQTPQSSTPESSPLQKPSGQGTLLSPIDPLKGAQIQQLPAAGPTIQAPNAPTTSQSAPQSDPEPSATTPAAPQKPADPPAIVDIKLSNGEPSSGSDSAINPNGLDALIRSARGQFIVGNYQAAAGTYARALSAGANPAVVNQRLGQCYEHLGRNSDAIDAYSKAIQASESAMSKGRGDKTQLASVLDASRQALKNLQGG